MMLVVFSRLNHSLLLINLSPIKVTSQRYNTNAFKNYNHIKTFILLDICVDSRLYAW